MNQLRFKSCFNLLLSSVVVVSTEAAKASTWSEELKTKIDANVEKHFLNESQVGLVVGVMKDREIHFWSYGEKVRGGSAPPDADTFFEMGSITKTYTATLLALEVLKGTLRLEDSVERFWPELKGTDAGKITFQELASHTSGLPRMPDNFAPADLLNPYKDYDETRLSEFLKGFKQTQPGPHAYAYSNVGLGMLGYILAQKLNSQSYRDYLAANLLNPLGLHSTKAELAQQDLANAAQGHDSFFSPMPFWNLNVLEPAGVLKTTARDLLRFLGFNMTTDSGLIGQAMQLAQTQRLAWRSTQLGRHLVLTHGGATGGYRANLVFDASEKLGAVVLSNTDVAPICLLAPVFDVPCEIQKYKSLTASAQARLVGSFDAVEIGLSAEVFVEGGQMGIYPKGQSRLKLWPQSDFEFSIPDAQAIVVFKPAVDGVVDEFELRQNGQTFTFKRR